MAIREISDQKVLTKEPLVSVVMTTYNHEPYIARAIEGVLMQKTCFPIELIIGEDCSTDRTREIVIDYQKNNPDIIRVITAEENVGLFENERRMHRFLRGKYVAFCEGDDYWTHPKKLQMQVDIMESNPEIGLVHSGYDRLIAYKNRLIRWKDWRPKAVVCPRYQDLFSQLLTGQYLFPTTPLTSTVCMHKDLYLGVRERNPDSFRKEFVVFDTPTWLEASRLTKFGFIDEGLAVYNFQQDSISNTRNLNKRIAFYQAQIKMHLYLCRKYGCDKEVEEIVSLRHYAWLLVLAFCAGRKDVANECAKVIKGIKGSLSFSQKLCFQGTINPVLRPLIMSGYKLYSALPDALHNRLRKLFWGG